MWWRRLLKFKPSIRTGKKGDLSDFERGMVVGGLSISETADLLGFSHTQPSLGFTENGPKKRKYPNIRAAVVWTKMPWWCQRRMSRLVRDDRKATVTQITTHYNQVCRIPSLNTQHIEPWSRWAPAAEDHTGCRSCLRTWHGDYCSHRLTKMWTTEDWKTLPGLMSLDFCCGIQM